MVEEVVGEFVGEVMLAVGFGVLLLMSVVTVSSLHPNQPGVLHVDVDVVVVVVVVIDPPDVVVVSSKHPHHPGV